MRGRAQGRRRHIGSVLLGASLALVSPFLTSPADATAPATAAGAAGTGSPDPATSRLRRLIRDDRTASIDRSGKVLFRDPVAPPAGPGPVAQRTGAGSTAREVAPYPLDQTFKLHSLPGSPHTILLDFNGALVTGTAWNQPDIGLPADFYPGWSLDGSRWFDPTERTVVQSVWRRVAEDYAPFDVDVTTQDPGQAAIDRSGPDDPVYGTRVLISSSSRAGRTACGGPCAGGAYFDVFDLAAEHDFYQPTWVFPAVLGDDVKDIAEVTSHEVGHTFGLLHDGTTSEGYYAGRGSWAPIMGAGYGRPIVQWSRGDYAQANNHEDDLAIIASHGAPLRADEAADTIAEAGPPPSHPAYITSDADQDVYALGVCAGEVTVRARRTPVSPDLDIKLSLLDANGAVVASADPPSATLSRDRAWGLSAWISTALRPGSYFVSVDGVGRGDPVTSYDGYGSVGAYTLTQTGCAQPTAMRREAAPGR